MSQHQKTDFPNFTKPQLDAALKLHGLPGDKPSQLADSFRNGAEWGASQKERGIRFSSAVIQEWSEDKCHHRLRNTETGRATAWAPYRAWTCLDGMVGYTAFFFPEEGVMPAAEFAEKQAVC